MESKNILHVIHGFGGGGAETWLLSVVKHLHQNSQYGLHFDFVITGGKPELFDTEIQQLGCEIFYLKYSYRNFFSFRKKLVAILKAKKYIAIHNHQDFVAGWHFLLGWGYLPKTRISHLHNPYIFVQNYTVNLLRLFSYRAGRILTYLLCTKITGTSNAVMDEYGYDKWPYKNKRIKPVYCGFDVSKFTFNKDAKAKICNEFKWEQNTKIALFVGRIDLDEKDNTKNQKNPEFAFGIAKQLVLNNTDWRFIFAGFKGTVGLQMEEETRDLKIDDKIILLNFRKDIPDLMSAAEILVFPSLWEGMGMVAIEAQANGLKVILSDTIPAEAVICKELVIVKKLEEGELRWMQSIIDLATAPFSVDRHIYSKKIEETPYSINNSILNMASIY